MSRRRKGQKIDGVFLLDKPSGMTSNAALQKARRFFDAQKAGHTGTLDPLARGLLPLCFGEAAKFADDLLNADKTYLAEITFGARTDTGDREGETIEEAYTEFSEADMLKVLQGFLGEQWQTPPMYSAIKVKGRKLYDLAREGKTIEREPRKINIKELKLVDLSLPHASVKVVCSKGTYIRVLGEDIGKALGCAAFLSDLQRTGVGKLSIEDALTFEELEQLEPEEKLKVLSPVDSLLSSLSSVVLNEDAAGRFVNGQSQRYGQKDGNKKYEADQPVRVYKETEEPQNFLGKGRLRADGLLMPERLLARAEGKTEEAETTEES